MAMLTFYLAMVASIIAAVWRPKTWMLWALALTILLVSPKGVRWWNQYHYWLGSKYHTEMGLFDLYECTQVARDSHGLRRDLTNYGWRTGPGACSGEFTQSRWAAFAADVTHVDATYDHLRRTITDKGLNATPPWLAFGKPLANWFTPAQVALIDPVLMLAAFAVAVRTVGWRQSGYALLFIVSFWGTYDRLWGNYIQYAWLAAGIAAVSLLQHNRESRWGGALIGIAAALRVFPAVLLWGRSRRVWMAAIASGAVMGVIGLTAGGMNAYVEMVANMHLHSSYIRTEPFNVSLANTVTLADQLDRVYLADNAMRAGAPYSIVDAKPGWWLYLPLVIGGGWAGVLFGLVTLSRYYYTIHALLMIERPELTRWLFGINAVTMVVMHLHTSGATVLYGVMLFGLFTGMTAWRVLPRNLPVMRRLAVAR